MRVAVLGIVIVFLFSSCTNIGKKSGLSTTGKPPVFVDPGLRTGSYTHQLRNVRADPVAGGSGGSGGAQISLIVSVKDNVPNVKPLEQFCGIASNPCLCELKWKETNTNGEFLYDRLKRLSVTQVQSKSVACIFPKSDWDEIASGVVISLRIVPGAGNSTGINTNTIPYRKGQTTNLQGDINATVGFLDDVGTLFLNIHRYTCHSKREAPHEILNRYQEIPFTPSWPQTLPNPQPPTKPPLRVPLGSCFCTAFQAGNAGGGGSGACSSLPCPQYAREGFSAQNYYRNFYLQSNLLGQIEPFNDTYECPTVLETLKHSASSDGNGMSTIPAEDRNRNWPLDSSFALASEWSAEWSIGVTAASTLTRAGSGNTNQAQPCTNSSPGFIENGVLPRCLGYAKPANPDGTCGMMQTSRGLIRPLVRLRRYRAVLPPRFDPNGDLEGQGSSQSTTIYPAVDEVYVADRLVMDNQANLTGEMIYGPKPCNYAWFDHEGVVNRTGTTNDFDTSVYTTPTTNVGVPGYVATSRYYKNSGTSAWDSSLSVNPDGLIFPNHDRLGGGIGNRNQASCSASLPIVNYTQGKQSSLNLFTSNSNRPGSDWIQLGDFAFGSRRIYKNEIHLRPIDPWVPQYYEDTSFRACVPMSENFTDPPLHFFKDFNNHYGWCAEVYPSQNPYWSEINRKRKQTNVATSFDQNVVLESKLVGFKATGMTVPGARVAGYTSHKNSGYGGQLNCSGTVSSQICEMTSPSSVVANCKIYLGRSSDATCDRTVTFDANRRYRDFPIGANDVDTEAMIKEDLSRQRSFSCAYSVSPDPSKVNAKYPSSACCGVRNGTPILNSLIQANPGTGGHLEPYEDPSYPDIRNCGSPVR